MEFFLRQMESRRPDEFRAIVVGFEDAHIGHGGEGAMYVRIRRNRGARE